MRKLLASILLGLLAWNPAYAQKTKATLITEINTNFPDNTTGLITPAILRSTTIDMVNSWYGLIDATNAGTGQVQASGYALSSAAGLNVLTNSGTYTLLSSSDGSENIFLGTQVTDPSIIMRSTGYQFQTQAAVVIATLSTGTSPEIIMGRTAGNQIAVSGTPAGNTPFIDVQGTDTNISLTITTKGTGQIAFQGNNFGETNFIISGAASNTVNFPSSFASTTGNAVSLFASGSDTNIGISVQAKGTGTVSILGNNGNNTLGAFTGSTTAVNFLQFAPANTAGAPSMLATGSDTNVNMVLATRGAGNFQIGSNNGNNTIFLAAGNVTAANFVQINSANTGGSPSLTVGGSDTNISLVISPKGTGAIAIGGATNNGSLVIDNTAFTAGINFFTGNTGGHFALAQLGGAGPSLTAGCNGAGSTITSNNSGGDIHGTVTGQTAAATTCTITFGTAFGAIAECFGQGYSAPLTGAFTPATGTLVVNFASTANYKFAFFCIGI